MTDKKTELTPMVERVLDERRRKRRNTAFGREGVSPVRVVRGTPRLRGASAAP